MQGPRLQGRPGIVAQHDVICREAASSSRSLLSEKTGAHSQCARQLRRHPSRQLFTPLFQKKLGGVAFGIGRFQRKSSYAAAVSQKAFNLCSRYQLMPQRRGTPQQAALHKAIHCLRAHSQDLRSLGCCERQTWNGGRLGRPRNRACRGGRGGSRHSSPKHPLELRAADGELAAEVENDRFIFIHPPIYSPRSFRCVTARDFVATR